MTRDPSLAAFEEVHGVRVFPDHSHHETREAEDTIEKLLADARAHGCEEALVRNDHDVRYLTDANRARYIDFLEIAPDARVLEIGASMGQHTHRIARLCAHLDALEVVPWQARFARLWCDEKELGNVRVSAGGGSGFLPFEDEAYDLVIMNYVLEWSAARAEIPAADFHLRLLSQVSRVLRPGGRLFVSTKNRYALRLLIGGTDEHLGIRFGSALPRGLSRRLAHADRHRRGRVQGHLHSRAEFEALLRRAGFGALHPILCFPDARYPRIMAPFDEQGFRALRELDGASLSRRERLYVALPDVLKRRVAASHVYIAEKSAAP